MIAIQLKKRHRDFGQQQPWYWGFGYHDYAHDEMILYIIPLNWVVGLGRRLWLWLRKGTRDAEYEKIRYRAWKHGWDAAKKQPDWDF